MEIITDDFGLERKRKDGIVHKADYDDLIKAYEKQTPIKPNIEGDKYADGHLVYDTWICPNCKNHYEIDYDNYEYCPKCGQHIDRSQLNYDLGE